MCTCITFENGKRYFGRTLDVTASYGEEIVVIPRRFDLGYAGVTGSHLAMMGVAHIAEGCPLMYDGINEKGLAAAALNFPGCAAYRDSIDGMLNMPSFAVIPRLLGECACISEARRLLEKMNVTGEAFAEKYPATTLHWMFADKNEAIVAEQTKDGMRIHENNLGVMTNSPAFDIQVNMLNQNPDKEIPGGLSSSARFARAAFAVRNSISDDSAYADINRFFHIAEYVSQAKGLNKTEEGFMYTAYTVCYDTEGGICYFTTYDDRRIHAVRMHDAGQYHDMLRRYTMDSCTDNGLVYLY